MAIFAEFFEHANFGGAAESFTLSNYWRYQWIKFGSVLRNQISAMRASASSGFDGNVYGFTTNDFLGNFAGLNMGEGWTCWWSYVGDALNDDIESAILVNRSKTELAIEMEEQIAEPFKTGFDAAVQGTQVSRRGEPRIYSVFWPSYDPTRKFVRIDQDLQVAIDWWPDYDANVKYDLYLYLDNHLVKGYAAWTHTWVEGGIFSGDIIDSLHPKLVAGAGQITQQLQSSLALLNLLAALAGYRIQAVYLLPGSKPPMPPPASNFGTIGSAYSNSTLVLPYEESSPG